MAGEVRDPREAASRAVLAAFHDLHPRIPGIETGDCHCNLLTEVALDAVMPVLLAAGRRQAADAIRERAEAAKTVDLTGPRAVRYRALLAAARFADNPLTPAEAAEALAAGNAVVCHLDEAGRPIRSAEGAPAESVEEAGRG